MIPQRGKECYPREEMDIAMIIILGSKVDDWVRVIKRRCLKKLVSSWRRALSPNLISQTSFKRCAVICHTINLCFAIATFWYLIRWYKWRDKKRIEVESKGSGMISDGLLEDTLLCISGIILQQLVQVCFSYPYLLCGLQSLTFR